MSEWNVLLLEFLALLCFIFKVCLIKIFCYISLTKMVSFLQSLLRNWLCPFVTLIFPQSPKFHKNMLGTTCIVLGAESISSLCTVDFCNGCVLVHATSLSYMSQPRVSYVWYITTDRVICIHLLNSLKWPELIYLFQRKSYEHLFMFGLFA